MQDPLEHILLHRCVNQHQKQKDEMLEPPCIPYLWIKPGTSHLQLHYSRTFPTLPPNHPLASPNVTPHYPPTSSSLPPHYPPSFPTLPPQYLLTFLAYYPSTFPDCPIHYPPTFSSSPLSQRVIGHSKTNVLTGKTRVTNTQATTHESWLVRCSPCALGFSWTFLILPPNYPPTFPNFSTSLPSHLSHLPSSLLPPLFPSFPAHYSPIILAHHPPNIK